MRVQTCFLALALLVCMSTTFQASEAATPVIVGGKVAKRAYRKHLAYVIVNTKSGSGFTCTGTIVGRRWILTAAHCVDSFNSSEDVDVSSSYAYISPRSLSKNLVKEYFFKSVYVHKNYKPLGLDSRHDIAVVELAKNIQRSKYFPTTLGDAPRPKTNVIGAGYGVLNEDGTPTRFAMQTKVVAQSFRTCASRESNSIRKYLRNKLQVCATSLGFPNEGRTDTCCKYIISPHLCIPDHGRKLFLTFFVKLLCTNRWR